MAFFSADMDRSLCVMPPLGLRRPGRVWQLHEALRGRRPASRSRQACVGDVFEKSQPPRVRITPCTGAFYNETWDIAPGVHGGDFGRGHLGEAGRARRVAGGAHRDQEAGSSGARCHRRWPRQAAQATHRVAGGSVSSLRVESR
eukprot:8103972-Pyramimonas_sp.AAC.1